MSVKAAQQRGSTKRAFCGVCFLVAGGLKPGALVFVSGFGSVFGNSGIAAAAGVAGGAGGAGVARLRGSGSTFSSGGGTGRGFGVGLVDSLFIAGLLTSFRTINRRCCYYFFLRLFNDGLFDFDNGGIGNGGNYNVGMLRFRNLALKYSINMHIVNETVGVSKAGRDYKLSDYLQVKTLSQEASLIGDISFCA